MEPSVKRRAAMAAPIALGRLDARVALVLQRAIGNRALGGLMAGAKATPPLHNLARCGAGGSNCGGACRHGRNLDEEFAPLGSRSVRTGVARVLARTTYHPGEMHDHRPSNMWDVVQAHPNSGWQENLVCSTMSPRDVVRAAVWSHFDGKPLALAHLNHYLSTGAGRDFFENANINRMMRRDRGVQTLIASLLPNPRPARGRFRSWTRVEQHHYSDQDLLFSFGAIDRLDFEADFRAGTLHVWFQDRYEWHPSYRFYSHFPGDGPRDTNCIHAALVELKAGGVAKDYWMKGEATVPLSVLPTIIRPTMNRPSPNRTSPDRSPTSRGG